MTSDAFTATNNPLPSPWASVTGFNAFESMGGAAFPTANPAAMVYTGSQPYSEVVFLASDDASSSADGGPALLTTGGSGYVAAGVAGEIYIVKWTSGVEVSDNGGTGTNYVDGDRVAMYFDGNDVVISKNGVEATRWTDSTHRASILSGMYSNTVQPVHAYWSDTAFVAPDTDITVDQQSIGTFAASASATTTVLTTDQTVAAGGFIVVAFGCFDSNDTLASVAGGGLSWTVDKNSTG